MQLHANVDKKLLSSNKFKCNKPSLKLGSQGTDVLELQKLLIHWGIAVQFQHAQFDSLLEQAVKAFQHKVFLDEDGIVGPLTWQALYTGIPVNMPVLQRGSQGRAVIILQETLNATKDYLSVVDGKFGGLTEAAVRRFQQRHGLVIDGIVGSCTWHSLSKTKH